jgi:hypothetical protein
MLVDVIVHHNLPCSRRDLVYRNFEVVIILEGGWNLTLRRLLPHSWLATLLPLVANATAAHNNNISRAFIAVFAAVIMDGMFAQNEKAEYLW